MSSILFSLEKAVHSLFENVDSSFSGNYKNSNADVKKWEKELFENLDTPTFRDDKANLKKDADNVISKYRKAYEEKIEL